MGSFTLGAHVGADPTAVAAVSAAISKLNAAAQNGALTSAGFNEANVTVNFVAGLMSTGDIPEEAAARTDRAHTANPVVNINSDPGVVTDYVGELAHEVFEHAITNARSVTGLHDDLSKFSTIQNTYTIAQYKQELKDRLNVIVGTELTGIPVPMKELGVINRLNGIIHTLDPNAPMQISPSTQSFIQSGVHCFPHNTMIAVPDGPDVAIGQIQPGALVLAFTHAAGVGAPALLPARVTRIFRNITQEWLLLSCGLTVTPGHRFLNEHHKFEPIEAILARDGGIVRPSGEILAVKACRIRYSQATCDLYEQGEQWACPVEGSMALAPKLEKGWVTYNFEVDGLHTYVAGGVCVHNDSLQTLLDTLTGATGYTFEGVYRTPSGTEVMNVSWGLDRFASVDLQTGASIGIFSAIGDPAAWGLTAVQQAAFKAQQDYEIQQFNSGTAGTPFRGVDGQQVTNVNGVDLVNYGYNTPDPVDPTSGQRQTSFGYGYDANGQPNYGPAQSLFGGLFGAEEPVVLDLSGNGIQITQLPQSSTYFDVAGDGLQHHTAWAGTGNAVLALDIGNSGQITNQRQVVFTAWEPGSTSDMQALRDVFDTNHNGRLDNRDQYFSSFRLIISNADGSQSLKSLTEAGVTSINLVPDGTQSVFADGSGVHGQTTFTRSNGSTGTVADASPYYAPH